MKRSFLLAALALVFACAAPALAEYGTWEMTWELSGYPPGLSNASFLGIAVADENTFYTAGLQQTAAFGMTSGWKTEDSGYTVLPVYYTDLGTPGDDCSILALMKFTLAVGSTGPDNVQYVDFGPDPECYNNMPFPACMFVCFFQFKTMINYSDDGGMTYNRASIAPLAIFDNYLVMDYVDNTTGFMAGGPNLIARTQDGGQNWVKINAPGDAETFFNDIDFVDANYGFVITGDSEPEEGKPKIDQNNPYTALAYAQWVKDRVRYLKDPVYRMQRNLADPNRDGKGTNGRIWRTTNGGQTWELVLSEPSHTFYNIHVVNDQVMWVLGEPHVYENLLFSLWRSIDGGDTWEDYSSHVPPMDLPYPGYAISAIGFSPSGHVGFLGGAAGNNIVYKSLLYYSADQGETWDIDTTVVPWGHPIISFGWANEKLAWQAGFDLSVYRYTQVNSAPIANAGPDQVVDAAVTVTLDGSGSYDPDGDALTYAWAQQSGETVTLDDAAAVQPTFTSPSVAGDLVFRLTVSDATDASWDDVTITVNPPADDDDDTTIDDDTAVDDDTTDDDAADDDDDNAGDDDDDSGCGC
jgi:hypothetical protein